MGKARQAAASGGKPRPPRAIDGAVGGQVFGLGGRADF